MSPITTCPHFLSRCFAVFILLFVCGIDPIDAAKPTPQPNVEWLTYANPSNPPIKDDYFYDNRSTFRKKPGDGGWIPGVVIAAIRNGMSQSALTFLKDRNATFTVTVSGEPQDRTGYKILEIETDPLSEDKTVKELLQSGFFEYASRESADAGPDEARIRLSVNQLFPARKVDSDALRKRLADTVVKLFVANGISSAVTAKRPFSYEIDLEGPSPVLATKQAGMWDRFTVTILVNKPTESGNAQVMELVVGFYKAKTAKSPSTEKPPRQRYKLVDEEEDGESHQFYSFCQLVAAKLSDEWGGTFSSPFVDESRNAERDLMKELERGKALQEEMAMSEDRSVPGQTVQEVDGVELRLLKKRGYSLHNTGSDTVTVIWSLVSGGQNQAERSTVVAPGENIVLTGTDDGAPTIARVEPNRRKR